MNRDKVQSQNMYTKSWTRSVESDEAADSGAVGYGGEDFEKSFKLSQVDY
jgi:hypothetical protein